MNIADLFDEATLFVGVILIIASFAAFWRTRKFITRCRTADGYVAGYNTEDSDEGVSYFSQIRFADSAGVEHEILGSGLRQPPEVGKRVSITYDPSYPTNAWVTGSAAPWVIPWVIVLVGAAVVVAAFVISIESG